jgi:hypothetical protein
MARMYYFRSERQLVLFWHPNTKSYELDVPTMRIIQRKRYHQEQTSKLFLVAKSSPPLQEPTWLVNEILTCVTKRANLSMYIWHAAAISPLTYMVLPQFYLLETGNTGRIHWSCHTRLHWGQFAVSITIFCSTGWFKILNTSEVQRGQTYLLRFLIPRLSECIEFLISRIYLYLNSD